MQRPFTILCSSQARHRSEVDRVGEENEDVYKVVRISVRFLTDGIVDATVKIRVLCRLLPMHITENNDQHHNVIGTDKLEQLSRANSNL